MENASTSIWRSLLITILPLFLGTLIFGMMLESYKNELSFRSDIMKEYYLPLVKKENECSNNGKKLSMNYLEMASNYELMALEYNSMKNGSGPRLTDEYKSYLTSLLKKTIDLSANAEHFKKDVEICHTELHQLLTNAALVTGTLSTFKKINNQSNQMLKKLDDEASEEGNKFREILGNIDVNRIKNDFFKAGDPLETKANSEYTDIMMTTTLTPMINFLKYANSIENRRESIISKLGMQYNSVLENEISARYERNWVSKFFF